MAISTSSISAGASSAPAADALYRLILLELLLWHSADAGRVEVRLLGLDAAQAAQLLVSLLLPLGDQVGVRVSVLEQPVIELFRDRFLLIVEIVDVAGACVQVRVCPLGVMIKARVVVSIEEQGPRKL